MRSVANLTRRDGEEFLALAPRVPVRTEVEAFPLEQANEALEAPAQRADPGCRRAKSGLMSRLSDLASWASRHRRLLGAVQLIVLVVFFASLAWAIRGSVRGAAHDVENANLVLFALGCAALAAYYLVFVLGWMRILSEWGVQLTYPVALRAEMLSMLAKYIPGAIWAPAARVLAARRARRDRRGSRHLLDAARGRALGGRRRDRLRRQPAVRRRRARTARAARRLRRGARHPRPAARLPAARRAGCCTSSATRRSCRTCADGRSAMLLVFYAGTWVLGGFALWLLLRSVGAPSRTGDDRLPRWGGRGRRDRRGRSSSSRPRGSAPREASMYGLMLAVATPGQALGAVALNRVALTLVELLVLFVGGLAPPRGRTGAGAELTSRLGRCTC